MIDLQSQHRTLRRELMQAIERVLDRADFVLGEEVARFEEEFAAFCGTRYAVGVDSGLSALELALRALGCSPGDEIILPDNTFVATAAAVTFAGAKPIPVEPDPLTHNIDPEAIEAAITPRTMAIIPVHLYGLPAAMDRIDEIARRHGLAIVEDACQAHGAALRGRRVGSIGHAGAFSFYPTKNLGGCGDAGMVVTDDVQVAARVRAMRNCGQVVKNLHELPPFNHRLDTIQAAMLRVKLRHLPDWIAARQRHAARYNELLAESELARPAQVKDNEHTYHLYVIRSPYRDRLRAFLDERGIGTGIHYPYPIHLQPFYARQEARAGQFPISEQMSNQVLSLPMYPDLTPEQVEYVAQGVLEFSLP